MKVKALPAAALCLAGASPVFAGFESPSSEPRPGRLSSAAPWDLSLRASIGHNDNVNLVPDGTTHPAGKGTSSDYKALQLEGSYRFYQSGNISARAALSANTLWYQDKLESPATWNIKDYGFYTLNPSLQLAYRTSVAGIPARIVGSYAHYRENGHSGTLEALGLRSHEIDVSAALYPESDLQITMSLRRGWDDFEVEFPSPSLDSRDADRYTLDLSLRTWFAHGQHNLTVGLGYVDNDAEGSNFSYDGYNLRARFESGFLKPVWLAAEIKHGNHEYGGFVSGFIPGPGRSSQDVTTLEFQALWPIDESWRLDAFYRREQYNSDQAQFEADVNILGAGISYRF